MKKKILFILALFFVFIGRINAFTGDGSQANPYVIKEGESVSVDNCSQTYVVKTAAYKDNIALIQYDKDNHKCLISGLKASTNTFNVEVGQVSVASNVKYVKVVENTDTSRTPQKFAKLLGRYSGEFNDLSYITYAKVAELGNYNTLNQTATQTNNKKFIITVAFYDTKFYINYGYGSDEYTFNFPVLFELTYNQTEKFVSYDSRGETSTKKEVETYLTRMFFYWKYEVLSEEEIIAFIKSQPTSFMEEYVKRTSSVGTWGNSTNEVVRVNFNVEGECIPLATGLEKIKLVFNSNGGTNIDSKTVLVGGTVDNGDLSSPTKDGYIFDGWYADEALTKKIGSTLTITNISNLTITDASTKTLVEECLQSDGLEQATLYAKWVEDGSGHGAVDPESEDKPSNPNTGATITFIAFMAIMLAFIVLLSKNNKKIYKI